MYVFAYIILLGFIFEHYFRLGSWNLFVFIYSIFFITNKCTLASMPANYYRKYCICHPASLWNQIGLLISNICAVWRGGSRRGRGGGEDPLIQPHHLFMANSNLTARYYCHSGPGWRMWRRGWGRIWPHGENLNPFPFFPSLFGIYFIWAMWLCAEVSTLSSI